jgi:hypothetical protein
MSHYTRPALHSFPAVTRTVGYLVPKGCVELAVISNLHCDVTLLYGIVEQWIYENIGNITRLVEHYMTIRFLLS